MVKNKLKKIEVQLNPKIQALIDERDRPISLWSWSVDELIQYILVYDSFEKYGTEIPKAIVDKENKTNWNCYNIENLTEKERQCLLSIPIDELKPKKSSI